MGYAARMPAPNANPLHTARTGPARPHVDAGRCTGCGRCVAACEPNALSLESLNWKKTAALHAAQACTGCAACARVCPFEAIRMRRPVLATG